MFKSARHLKAKSHKIISFHSLIDKKYAQNILYSKYLTRAAVRRFVEDKISF
jgi:hypothetical protein